jgi:hypothetical protein
MEKVVTDHKDEKKHNKEQKEVAIINLNFQPIKSKLRREIAKNMIQIFLSHCKDDMILIFKCTKKTKSKTTTTTNNNNNNILHVICHWLWIKDQIKKDSVFTNTDLSHYNSDYNSNDNEIKTRMEAEKEKYLSSKIDIPLEETFLYSQPIYEYNDCTLSELMEDRRHDEYITRILNFKSKTLLYHTKLDIQECENTIVMNKEGRFQNFSDKFMHAIFTSIKDKMGSFTSIKSLQNVMDQYCGEIWEHNILEDDDLISLL